MTSIPKRALDWHQDKGDLLGEARVDAIYLAANAARIRSIRFALTPKSE